MMTIIIYDIQDTNNRNKVIKNLQHYGLKRIQKSAFTGELNKKDKQELSQKLEKNIQTEKDSILIIPVCDKCQEKIINHGKTIKLEDEEDYLIE